MTIPLTSAVAEEALLLATDILAGIELGQVSLESTFLKATRLARLLNDENARQAFEYEVHGYSHTPDGVPPAIYELARWAGRETESKDEKTGNVSHSIDARSIGSMEANLMACRTALTMTVDPDISISSANPSQWVHAPPGNLQERQRLTGAIWKESSTLSKRRGVVHRYVSEKFYELKYSAIPAEVFSRIRSRVDGQIGTTVPEAVRQFTSVYENLASDNPEDWSNAVHSCRRILQSLADVVFPPRADQQKQVRDKTKTIKLGPDNYINRLIAYAEERSVSERFTEIVGSQLDYLGNRLDSVFAAAHKGTHHTVDREEADRYVVYTYLLVGDLLTLSGGLEADDSQQIATATG